MAVYGAFTSSVMGMMSQSTALNTIGTNIANVSTDGYKKTDTNFSTVMSKTMKNLSDLGGVKPSGLQRIDKGGSIVASDRNLDTAISGKGFFVLNTELDGGGDTYYARDGSFNTVPGADITVTADDGVSTITSQEAYLVNKNGHYVMGWQPLADGTFNTSAAMSAMRVDAYAFQSSSITTTQASLDLNLPAKDVAGTQHLYNIQVYDSLGAEQTVALEFTKEIANNTWTATPTWMGAPTAQVDTVSLVGSVEAGDQYSVTVGGTTVTYAATGAEASMSVIRDNLLALVNANSAIIATVTPAASGTSDITLTAATPGSSFTSSSASTQALTDVAQVDTVALGGAFEVGDTFTVTIGGTDAPYAAIAGDVDLDGVRDKLILAVNGAGLGVTASPGGAGELVLTANVPGTGFTLATSTADGGGGGAQTATITNNTANYLALPDNLATASVTTTANNTGAQTGTPTTLTFDSNAQLLSPTTLPIAATWANGGTVSTTLDISSMSQFDGNFTPFSYSQNGNGTGELREYSFDTQGRLQGNFTNGQSRPLYRLGLAVFTNANGLEMVNGNLFKESELSGTANVIAPSENSYGSITGNAREMSNVDVGEEFTNMIMTQRSYSSAATVFRTVDEMITVARDLKR